METQTQNEKQKLIEKSMLLTIPSCVAGSTLKNIQDRDIKTEYIGVNETGDLTMKISYFEWQEPFLDKIIREMKSNEAGLILIFLALAGSAIESYQNTLPLKKEPYKEYFKYNGIK